MLDATAKLTPYDADKLHTLGWIKWTDRGEENMYFTLSDGSECFVKIDDMRQTREARG